VPRWRRLTLGATLGAGAGLLLAAGAIHLYLWTDNYRFLPTIGPLFLFQAIGAFGLAVAVLASRRFLTVLAGVAFLLATIGGYLISVNVGLFGFQDTLAAPLGHASIAVEAVGVGVLAIGAAVIPKSDRLRLPWQ
jgi:hypothetical protein